MSKSKRGRKPQIVKTEKYLDEYFKKNKSKLDKLGISDKRLKALAKNELNVQYNGRTKANKAINELIKTYDMDKETFELYSARKKAEFTGDKRLFNNKKFENRTYLEKDLGYDEYGDKAVLNSYYEIANSPYILGELTVQSDAGSPYQVWRYLDASVLE